MVLTFPEQLQFQDILVRIGYVDECAYHAQCLFRFGAQNFQPADRIRASDGDAVDLLVNRHFLPANWNPPFIPHAPGAEGLELLQRSARLVKTDKKSESGGQQRTQSQARVSLSKRSESVIDTADVANVPFTLAVFMNQSKVTNADIVICIWELHNGQNQFDFHRKEGFDIGKTRKKFKTQHNLIKKCSNLHPVKFSRPSWRIDSDRWYVGSFVKETAEHAVVACVIYRQGCASTKVLTLPRQCQTEVLRNILNAVHGTLIRLNGVVLENSIILRHGDLLEYHAAESFQSFHISCENHKVQICLDAAIAMHTPAFDEDGIACEILPNPSVRDALSTEDGWHFRGIPEGANLHKATFEALHVQQESFDDAITAYELYVDGATKGDISGWAVVAVAVTGSGRIFRGCIGGLTEIDQGSSKWIGAKAHSNIDAELTAMTVATAFAYFGSSEHEFIVRPDLALSRLFLEADSTSRQDSVLASVVHVLGQARPDNVKVVEVRAHCGDPWNELADTIAKHVVAHRTEIGIAPWKTLNLLALSPSAQKWEWLRVQPGSYSKTLPVLHGSAVWQPAPSSKRIGVEAQNGKFEASEVQISCRVATYNGLALGDDEQSSSISGGRSVRLDSQFHKHKIALAGIQESRTSPGARCTDNYKIFSSGFQQCGRSRHFGCEIWLHKTLPLCKTKDGKVVRLADCKITITNSEPRILIARLEGPIDLYVAVAHAPCVTVERSIEQVKQWWASLANTLADMSNGNMVVLIDANAPLAEDATNFFGQHHAERMNQQGFEFQDFLVSKELYAPSTFFLAWWAFSHVATSKRGPASSRLCDS